MKSTKQKVQQVVSEIYAQQGKVRPSTLLEAAKLKSSPAHDAFEWNDNKAGHEYRLIQARTWIRKVRVIVEEHAERLVHVPTMEADNASPEGYYKPISVVLKNRTEFEAALGATLANFNAARVAYEELKRAARGTTKKERLPNFSKADKGFELVEEALEIAG